MHRVCPARARAWASVGNSRPHNVAMMAITTSNSTKVNAGEHVFGMGRIGRGRILFGRFMAVDLIEGAHAANAEEMLGVEGLSEVPEFEFGACASLPAADRIPFRQIVGRFQGIDPALA